jgi:hypothetical protein
MISQVPAGAPLAGPRAYTKERNGGVLTEIVAPTVVVDALISAAKLLAATVAVVWFNTVVGVSVIPSTEMIPVVGGAENVIDAMEAADEIVFARPSPSCGTPHVGISVYAGYAP